MLIRASAEIRQNYNKISRECKETDQPIYLTKNGKGDLVVMDIATYEREKQQLAAQKLVLEAYASEVAGVGSLSNEEVFSHLDRVLKEIKNG